jgi:hypothetical protein
MFARFLPVALALALAVPAWCEDSSAERGLAGFVESVNDGTEAGYRSFIKASFGEVTSDEEDEWVQWMAFLGERHDALEVVRVGERSSGAIVAFVHDASSGSWLKVTIKVESEAPYSVSSINVRKSMALSSAVQPSLTPEAVDSVLAGITREIRSDYVRRDFREQLVTSLLERAKSGNYRSLTNRFELARRISEDLDEIADDEHLSLQAPDFAAAIRERYYSEEEEAPAADAPPEDHGFTRAVVLEDNVALLEMSRFDGSSAAFATLERLLTPLAGARALFIDLRYSGGGDGEMVTELASYLFAEPTEIGARTKQRTTPKPLSASFAGMPVYILTSSTTRSAAEALAFDLQQKGRAKLFGAVTAGAGYRSDFRFLPGDFVLSLSVGDPYDAESGRGWERTGVKPDAECGVEEALDLALADLGGRSF